jgi:hypothetical protein
MTQKSNNRDLEISEMPGRTYLLGKNFKKALQYPDYEVAWNKLTHALKLIDVRK